VGGARNVVGVVEDAVVDVFGSASSATTVDEGPEVDVVASVVDVTAHSGWSASPAHAVTPTRTTRPATATAVRRTRRHPPCCTAPTLEVVPFDR